MPRPEAEVDLQPSVLDRLIDDEPDVEVEAPAHRARRLADLKVQVKRDLEWLLNSRRAPLEIPAGLADVRDSLLTFGLPDFTHANLSAGEGQAELRRSIERAIERFEPRLSDVVVTLVECRDFDRSLRFRIDARLRVEPAPEPITFDSLLKLPTKSFEVQAG
jgi:type VI secretion system protein ImpF